MTWRGLALTYSVDCAMLYFLFRLCFRRRFSRPWCDLACVVLLVAAFVGKSVIPLPNVLSLLLNVLLSYLAVRLPFRGQNRQLLFVLLIYYAMMFLVDAAAFGLQLVVVSSALAPVEQIEAVPWSLPLLSRTLMPPLILLSKRLLRKLPDGSDGGRKGLLFVPIPAMVCMTVFLYYPMAHGGSMGLFFLCIAGLLLAAGYAVALAIRMRKESKLRRRLRAWKKYWAVTQRYQADRERAWRETRSAVHDIRKHLAYVALTLEKAAYIKRLDKRLLGGDITGNHDIDAILSMFRSELPAHITLAVTGRLPPVLSWLDPVDMVTLLGNALENALEAAEQLPVETPSVINGAFRYDGHTFVVRLDNPTNGPVAADATLFSTKKAPGHGLGIQSMRAVIERYGGMVEFRQQDTRFIVKMLLQNIEER